MKINMLETVKHDGQTYEAEDTRTVPDGLGEYFCDMGWAKDASGAYAGGERDINKQRSIDPEKVYVGHKTSGVK